MVNHTLQDTQYHISNNHLHLHLQHQHQHLMSIISVVLYQKILSRQPNPTVPIDDDFTHTFLSLFFFFPFIYIIYLFPTHWFFFFFFRPSLCVCLSPSLSNHFFIYPQNKDYACALISSSLFITTMNCLDNRLHDRNTRVIECHSFLLLRSLDSWIDKR